MSSYSFRQSLHLLDGIDSLSETATYLWRRSNLDLLCYMIAVATLLFNLNHPPGERLRCNCLASAIDGFCWLQPLLYSSVKYCTEGVPDDFSLRNISGRKETVAGMGMFYLPRSNWHPLQAAAPCQQRLYVHLMRLAEQCSCSLKGTYIFTLITLIIESNVLLVARCEVKDVGGKRMYWW